MAKVICTLENASELISDVKFVTHRDGMISQEISDEAAARFASIPGYVLVGKGEDPEDTDGKKQKPPKPAGKSKDQPLPLLAPVTVPAAETVPVTEPAATAPPVTPPAASTPAPTAGINPTF